jgi:hypothetical protein
VEENISMNPISMYPMSPLCSSYGGPGKNINDSYEYSGIHIMHVATNGLRNMYYIDPSKEFKVEEN